MKRFIFSSAIIFIFIAGSTSAATVDFSSFGGQGTVNTSSFMTPNIGFTSGRASQGSVIDYSGTGKVIDIKVNMIGESSSLSQHFTGIDGDTTYEGFRTDAIAKTIVVTRKNNNKIDGSFVARGGIETMSSQTLVNRAMADSGAFGRYSATGNLGSIYKFSAIGYTSTQIVQLTGIPGLQGNGSFSTAGMTLKAVVKR